MRSLLLAVFGVLLWMTSGWPAQAQDATLCPAKSIRVIIPYPAGGATDIIGRTVAPKLSESWKVPVVVENKGGGNANIGADAVAKSTADGYTFLATTNVHAANATLFPKMSYQMQRDLQLIGVVAVTYLVPVVRSDSPIRSLEDLVATSTRRNINAGSSGNGAASHIGLELFKSVTGAKIQHVPYKGGGPAIVDLVGGQVDVIFALLPECLPHIQSGKLRALAVTSAKRSPPIPQVPTTAEAGIQGLEVTSWTGFSVPAGTQQTVVKKVNAELRRIVATAQTRSRLAELGFEPETMTVAEAEEFLKTEIARWGKIIREARITVD